MRTIYEQRYIIDAQSLPADTNPSRYYDFPTQDEVNALFSCLTTYDDKGMPASTYLINHAGDNGWGMIDSWLYTNTPINYNQFIFYGTCVRDAMFYEMMNYSYFSHDTWDLYDHYASQHVKFILIKRL